MYALVLIVFVPLALLLAIAVAAGLWHPRSGLEIVGATLRSEEAEAEIEAHDIDQMLDALADRRARAGRPTLGEEIAARLAPHLRDG